MKKYHHCVKFTYPLSFQTRIPKVDQHTGGKWLIHGTKHLINWSDTKVVVLLIVARPPVPQRNYYTADIATRPWPYYYDLRIVAR